MKAKIKDIIGVIMLIINLLYWIFLMGIADSLSMAGAIIGFCAGVCLIYLTKILFERLNIVSKDED